MVITDMKMPGMDGMALLERVRIQNPDLPVIMMTAFGTVEKALEAMRKGAFDYIFKPFKNEQLKFTVRKAMDHYLLVCKNRYLTQELQERYQFGNIIGKSAAMQRIYQTHREGRPLQGDRPDHRGIRDGKGIDRASHPFQQPKARSAVHLR